MHSWLQSVNQWMVTVSQTQQRVMQTILEVNPILSAESHLVVFFKNKLQKLTTQVVLLRILKIPVQQMNSSYILGSDLPHVHLTYMAFLHSRAFCTRLHSSHILSSGFAMFPSVHTSCSQLQRHVVLP